MAGGGEIKSTLTLDVSKFSSAIERATSNLDSLDKQLKNAGKVTAEFEKNVSSLGEDAAGSSEKFKLLEQTVANLAAKLNQVALSGFSEVSKGARKAKQDVGELADETARTGQTLLSASQWAKQYATAMESIKPSLQKITDGQKDLQKAQKETTKVTEESASAQIAAKTRVLESERASNEKIIADKQRLASELIAIEQKVRNESLAAKTTADNIQNRLGAYAGKNKIAEAMAPANRLDNNADFIKAQREETLRASEALQVQNAEIAKQIGLLADEKAQLEAAAVAQRKIAEAAIQAEAALKREEAALGPLNALINQAKANVDGLAEANILMGETALKAATDQIFAEGKLAAAQTAKKAALDREMQANLGKNALLQTIAKAEQEMLAHTTETLTAGEKIFQNNLASIFAEGAARKKAADEKIADEDRAAKAAEKSAKQALSAKQAADREAGASARQLAAERKRAAQEAAEFEMAQARQVAQMLRGIGQLWGASKIESGLKSSVTAAGSAEQTNLLMGSLNYTDEHNAQIKADSEKLAAATKFLSVQDAIKSRMSAIASLGHDDAELINKTLETAVKAANNLQTMGVGGHGDLQTILRNMYGVVEMRQQTNDAGATNQTMETLQKIIVGTQGKVQTSDMETVLRRLGVGAGKIGDDGLINLAALVDQFKVAGGEGGSGSGVSTVGTAIKMLQAYALGKPMTNKGVEEFSAAGVLDTGHLDPNSKNMFKDAKTAGFKDADLWLKDPVAAVQKMMPQIIEYTKKDKNLGKFYEGRDANDSGNQMTAVTKFLASLGFTVTAQQAIMTAGDPRSQKRIDEQRATIKGGKGIEQTNADADKTYERQVQDVEASLTNLKVMVGNTLLPVIKDVLTWTTKFVDTLTKLGTDNPLTATVATMATAFTGLGLAVSGIVTTFGAVGSVFSGLATIFGGVNASVATANGVWTGLKASVGEVILAISMRVPALQGILSGFIGLFTGSFAALVTKLLSWQVQLAGLFGWVLGRWISTIEIDGVTIGQSMENIFLGVELGARKLWANLQSGWISFKKFITFGTADTAASEAQLVVDRAKITEDRRSRMNTSKWMTDTGQSTGTGGFIYHGDGDGKRGGNGFADPRSLGRGETVDDVTARKRDEAEAVRAKGSSGKSLGGLTAPVKAERIPREFEDTFAKAFSDATSKSSIDQLKLDSLASGESSYADQARAMVAKMWMGGDLDQGKDPSKRKFLTGASYDKDGRASIAGKGYDKTKPWSLDQMDWSATADIGGGVKKSLKDLQDLYAAQLKMTDARKAEEFAKERAKSTDQEASTAVEKLTTAYAGQTDAMRALNREFARQEVRTPGLKDDTAYQSEKRKALANQAIADYANMGVDLRQKNAELQAGLLTTERARLVASVNATFDAEMKKVAVVRDSLDQQIKLLEVNGLKGTAEWQKAIDARKAGETDFTNHLRLEEDKRTQALQAPIDKLAREWKDTYKQIETMENDWASKFMDNLDTTIEGGKVDWAAFIKGMGSDLLKTTLKSTLGDTVSGAFKSIGSTIMGAFGLSRDAGLGKPDGSATNPLYIRDVSAALGSGASGIAGGVQSEMKKVTDTVGSLFSGMADTFKSVFSGVGQALSSAMGSSGSNGTASAIGSAVGSVGSSAWGSIGSWIGSLFANGGVMSSTGSMPLKMYSSGGVATSPQLAVFGEGSMNEAYVPLPDGRSIPVNMKGGASSTPNVTVNVVNQTGQQVDAKQGAPRFDGSKMILDVVLTALSQPGPYRDSLRSTMR